MFNSHQASPYLIAASWTVLNISARLTAWLRGCRKLAHVGEQFSKQWQLAWYHLADIHWDFLLGVLLVRNAPVDTLFIRYIDIPLYSLGLYNTIIMIVSKHSQCTKNDCALKAIRWVDPEQECTIQTQAEIGVQPSKCWISTIHGMASWMKITPVVHTKI